MNVSEILEELDDHGFTRVKRQRKLALLNDTYFDVCSREAWPFLQKKATITFPAGSVTPSNLPQDFSKSISLTIPSQGVVLEPERLDYMTKTFPDLTTARGVPYLYYFRGSTLHVYPAPGESTDMELEYYAQPVPLTEESTEADILLPRRHHRVLVLGTLAKLYLIHDDVILGQLFDGMFEARILRMQDDLWMRQFDRPERIYPLDEDLVVIE